MNFTSLLPFRDRRSDAFRGVVSNRSVLQGLWHRPKDGHEGLEGNYISNKALILLHYNFKTFAFLILKNFVANNQKCAKIYV